MSEFNSFEGCKPNMSFMPAYEDLNEAVFYMAASADREYAKLESAFSMAEVLGESYLMEETGIKGFFQNIIKWVKEQFEKLAGLFKKAIDTVQSKGLEFSNKVKNKIKDKTKVEEKLGKLKGGDKVYGKTYVYPEWNSIKDTSGTVWTELTALEKSVNAAVLKFADAKTDENDIEDITNEPKKSFVSTAHSIGLKERDGVDLENLTVDSAKISKALEETVQGKERELKAEDIRKEFSDMWNRTTDYRTTVVSLQKLFKGLKKYYDDTLRALNAAAKADSKSGGFAKANSGYSVLAKAVRAAKNLNNCIGGTAIKIINKRLAKEQMIVWRCVVAATVTRDKDKALDKAQEKLKASQKVEESASVDDITAQLFDFS